ncbi:hypothetical protein CFB40_28080 [Burkholderia sp. AU31652]|nr:hypothetical protein CFB40_28080 [Burkholderia sp. AU31652]
MRRLAQGQPGRDTVTKASSACRAAHPPCFTTAASAFMIGAGCTRAWRDPRRPRHRLRERRIVRRAGRFPPLIIPDGDSRCSS